MINFLIQRVKNNGSYLAMGNHKMRGFNIIEASFYLHPKVRKNQ